MKAEEGADRRLMSVGSAVRRSCHILTFFLDLPFIIMDPFFYIYIMLFHLFRIFFRIS